MGRNQDYTDGGIASFFEDRANGLNTATMHAPAALAGTYDIELLDALPAGTEVLRIDASGKLSTVVGSGGSLDTAYDFGGAGAGRVILTTDGPLELAGVDGLRLNTAIPKIEFETDVGDFNWRIAAAVSAQHLLFQLGELDADISDDAFSTILSIDSLRMVGINTANPQEALHVSAVSGDTKIRLQTAALSDASLVFMEDSVSRFELGYDDSAGGFVLGRTDFTNPVLLVEDVTGDVGINEVDPDAKLHVTSTAALASLIESSNALARLGLRASGTTDENQVGVMADGNDLILFGGAAARVVVQADGRVGIGIDPPIAKLHVDESVVGDGIRVTHSAANPAVNIIKSAGDAPCLRLQQNATGARAPYNMTAMTTGPTASADGDFWHVSSLNRLKFSFTGIERSILARSFRPFGPEATATIASGVLVVSAPIMICAAEGAGTTDAVDTISVGPAEAGDEIIVRPDTGDTITFNHGTGNLVLDAAGNKSLDGRDQMKLVFDGTDWLQLTPVMNLIP
jgi:hypothetical protein